MHTFKENSIYEGNEITNRSRFYILLEYKKDESKYKEFMQLLQKEFIKSAYTRDCNVTTNEYLANLVALEDARIENNLSSYGFIEDFYPTVNFWSGSSSIALKAGTPFFLKRYLYMLRLFFKKKYRQPRNALYLTC